VVQVILAVAQPIQLPGKLDRSSGQGIARSETATSPATALQTEQVGSSYILLIRRYRVTSGSTLPAKMAPSPTAAATSNRIFISQISLLSPVSRG
jgi:hypothetical protein